MPRHKEYSAAISARHRYACETIGLEECIGDDTGIRILHMIIHNILAENDHTLRTLKIKPAQAGKIRGRYSSSMRCTYYRHLDDKGGL